MKYCIHNIFIKYYEKIYLLLLILFISMNILRVYLDNIVIYCYGDIELPARYYQEYGMFPLEYYYLKTFRSIIYIKFIISIFLLYKKLKVKIFKINILYISTFVLSILVFAMISFSGVMVF